MKKNWDTKKISQVCIIKPPKSEAKSKLNANDKVSFLPMEDLGIEQMYATSAKEKSLDEVIGSYTYFADNDVLLAKITPCFENGKIGIARNLTNGIGFGSSEYFVFRPNNNLLPEYLYHFLTNELFRQEGHKRMTGAVGHKRVPIEFIENYFIPIPSLSEQHRIVAILDEAFASIAIAKENAEKNLKNAREVFESFLQKIFENASSNCRFATLREICSFVRGPFGGSLKKSIFVDNGYLVYEQYHAINNDFIYGRYYIDQNKFQEMKRFEVISGDLLISCSGTMGKIAIVPENIKKGIINQALLKLTPDTKKINRNYLKYFLETDSIQNKYFKNQSGATIQNISSVSTLKDITVILPSLNEQFLIVSKLDSISEETQNLESIYRQKITALDELKKSLLQKAFAGEL